MYHVGSQCTWNKYQLRVDTSELLREKHVGKVFGMYTRTVQRTQGPYGYTCISRDTVVHMQPQTAIVYPRQL